MDMSNHPPVAPALPSGPGAPAVRQTLRWMSRPYELLRECAAQFGDAFTLDLGSHGRFAMFSAPEAVRAIFTADPEIAHAGKGHRVLLPLLGQRSLLLLEGLEHQRERRLIMPSFQSKRVDAYGALIRAEAREALARFEPGQEVAIHDVMQEVSLSVILRAVFGLEGGPHTDELARQIRTFLDDPRLNMALLRQLREDGGGDVWRTFQQHLGRIDHLLFEEIGRRRALVDPGRHDVMSVLLGATYEDGSALDDAALRDELVTLLMTGYETSATALAWAFHWVHADGAIERRLRDELRALGSDPAPAALEGGAPYLRAVCHETLRLHPILPMVARQLQRPLVIQGYQVPAGVNVAACIYLAHQRAAVFPEPDRFVPDRFLGRDYSPYEYLPFGGGPRRCAGMTLALLEMKIVLGTVLAACDLEPVGPPVRPVRRSVTIGPSGGARMRVVRRG